MTNKTRVYLDDILQRAYTENKRNRGREDNNSLYIACKAEEGSDLDDLSNLLQLGLKHTLDNNLRKDGTYMNLDDGNFVNLMRLLYRPDNPLSSMMGDLHITRNYMSMRGSIMNDAKSKNRSVTLDDILKDNWYLYFVVWTCFDIKEEAFTKFELLKEVMKQLAT